MAPTRPRKRRGNRWTKGTSAIILLLAFLSPMSGADGASKTSPMGGEVDPRTFVPSGPLLSEHIFKNYVIKTYREEGGGQGSLEILRDGHRIYGQMTPEEGGEFLVGELYESNTSKDRIAIGKDITGRGVPNLIVSEWTAGAHCCFIAHIFEMSRRFRRIASIGAQHGPLDFEDLDGDGILEFLMRDWTFAYWRTCFACSPAPEVILRFRNGAYRMAPELMRKAPLSPGELAARSKQLRESDEWREQIPPPDVWRVMLDLIYTGNPRQAWELFEMAWRPGLSGKKDFLKKFRAQLARSPFSPSIKSMNRD